MARAISDRFHVVGSSNTPGDAAIHAFLYDPDTGGPRDLGTLGGLQSEALGVNDFGHAVGKSLLADGSTVHAFLWQPHTGLVDLNSYLPANSGWELIEARDIREDGVIVGVGRIGGVLRAFRMQPPVCDLGIQLAVNPNPALHRRAVTFTATVTNHGPAGATGVLATVVLPSTWPFTGSTPSQGSVTRVGTDFQWAVGSLANGASATLALTLLADTEGKMVARAAISGNKEDPNQANNLIATSLQVDPNPSEVDLDLQISATPEPAGRNRELTYDFTIRNLGPDPATIIGLAVSLTDTLTYVRSSVSQGTLIFAIGNEVPPAEHRNYIIGTLGTLAPGGVITGQFVLQPTVLGSANYIATVNALETEPDYSNNSREGTHTVIAPPSADVRLEDLGDAPDPVQQGNDVTYEFRVTNNGPDQATSVRVLFDLPVGAQYVGHSVPRGTVTQPGGDFQVEFGGMTNGEVLSFTVTIRYPDAGSKSYSATAISGADDANPANNSVSGTTTVVTQPTAELQVTGQVTPNPIRTGNNLTYTFVVRNNGTHPGSAQFTGVISAGQTFQSASATVGTPTHTAGTVTWNLGTLAVNGSETLTVIVTATTAGTASIQGTVTGDLPDAVAGNNVSTPAATVNDVPRPDLVGQWVSLTQTTRVVRGRLKATLKGEFHVTNQGEVNSPPTVLRLYLSEDAQVQAALDRQIKSVNIPALRIGKVRKVKFTIALPAGVSASRLHALGLVDAKGRVTEASESNNVADFGIVP